MTDGGTKWLHDKLLERGADCPIFMVPHFYTRNCSWGEMSFPRNRFDTFQGFQGTGRLERVCGMPILATPAEEMPPQGA